LVEAEENALCEHVFTNVLSNAVKFSFEGSKILVTVKDIGEFITVEFQDFGTGIQETRLERGYLTSTQGTNGETGTGFGLMVMGYFLRKFGATIDIQSRAEGKDRGTTVTINLKKSLTTSSLPQVSQDTSANIYS
jgi:K+-sensing histidine kinase KdpD